MLGYVRDIMTAAERDSAIVTRDDALRALRRLGMDDFGDMLLRMPAPDFPKLSHLLPRMASDDVQDQWTGNHGHDLLRQSCAFVRSLAFNYARLGGGPISSATILDYGCGWGRLARLMYYFVDPSQLIGVDPWDRSIEECNNANLGPGFLKSDYLPVRLPTPHKFNLAYAFSVFTHTSERAAMAALTAVRESMQSGGIFCITVRPPEYWDIDASAAPIAERLLLRQVHAKAGFAFYPHALPPVDGHVTYGDASISLAWIRANAKGWRLRGVDRSLDDPYQLYVFLLAE